MTHAIYIAAILVLAGVACWLWLLSSARKAAFNWENFHAERWKEAAKKWWTHSDQLNKERAQMIMEGRSILDECEYLQASNRSLRGWNGRYRRKIAALEAELADLMGDEA